jgi:hypothetical protein
MGDNQKIKYYSAPPAYYTEEGGMQVERTNDRVRRSALFLANTYPQFCEINQARKNHVEIKLKDRTRK